MFSSPDEVKKFIEKEGVEFVDVRFTDLPGQQQHFNVPAATLPEDFFTEGVMFDGSSIRGFAAIHKSDMKLIPDPSTAYVDPFRAAKTLNVAFSIVEPRTGEPYERDPRQVAAKAEAWLKSTGIADTVYFGPEAEFYVFDDVRFQTSQNEGYYHIDSIEGAWNTGRVEEGGNRGYKTRYKGGYFPVPPVDHYADLRDQMSSALIAAGHRDRARAPRGRHRRPGRDQLQVRHPAGRGRRRAEVQVHRQERRVGQRQDRDVHAEAALRRQRLGHALPPVAVEGRLAAVLRRARLRRACRTRRATTSAACCTTRRRCSRSPTRR